MKLAALILALGAFALPAGQAFADPVTPRTITGYSAAAASQQGKPLEVPPGQGPMQDGAPVVAAEAGAEAGAGGQSVAPEGAAPAAQPRKVRYGLFGLSWRSQ